MKRLLTRLALVFTIILGVAISAGARPSTQARYIGFSNIQSTQATISWTNGSGGNRIVVVYPSNTQTTPTDNTVYTANSVYGTNGTALGGGYVVYKGSGNTRQVTVTGLSSGKDYYVRAYEFDFKGTKPEYNVTTAANNPRTLTTITNSPSTPVNTSPTGDGFTSTWGMEGGNYDGFILRLQYDAADIGSGNGTMTTPTNAALNSAGVEAGTDYWDLDVSADTTFTFTNLIDAVDYQVAASAYKGKNQTAFSSYSSVVTTPDDNSAPTFTIQYYKDNELTNIMSTPAYLQAKDYSLLISANEELRQNPTVRIDAFDDADFNDDPNDFNTPQSTYALGFNSTSQTWDYRLDLSVVSDGNINNQGVKQQKIKITATDLSDNASTNVEATNQATKAGYIDTDAPTGLSVLDVSVINGVSPANYYNKADYDAVPDRNLKVRIERPTVVSDPSLNTGILHLLFTAKFDDTTTHAWVNLQNKTFNNGNTDTYDDFTVSKNDYVTNALPQENSGNSNDFGVIAVDRAGNATRLTNDMINPNFLFFFDKTKPAKLTTDFVKAAGGTVRERFWNSTNNTLQVKVPLDQSDRTYEGPTNGKIIIEVGDGVNFNPVVNSEYIINWQGNDKANGYAIISLADTTDWDGDTQADNNVTDLLKMDPAFAEGKEAFFRVEVSDAAENQITYNVSTTSIWRDETAPIAISTGTTTGAKVPNNDPATDVVVSGYYNSYNSTINVNPTFDNATADSTLYKTYKNVGIGQIVVKATDDDFTTTYTASATDLASTDNGTTSFNLDVNAFTTAMGGIAEGSTVKFKTNLYDRAGNLTNGSTAYGSIIYDVTAPNNVNTVFPSTQYVKGASAVTIASSGTASNKVWISSSSATPASFQLSPNGTTTTNTTGLSTSITSPSDGDELTVGYKDYNVFVVDAAGNVNGPSTATLRVDDVAPTVVISDDNATNIVNGTKFIAITATITEADALNGTPQINITFSNNANSASNISANMTATANPLVWTYNWDVPNTVTDVATITSIVVSDRAGNACTAPTAANGNSLIYTVDNTLPVFDTFVLDNATDMTSNFAMNSETKSITGTSGTFTEPLATTGTVVIYKDLNLNNSYDNGTDTYWNGSAFVSGSLSTASLTISSNTFSYSAALNSVNATDGIYRVEATLTDAAENTANSSFKFIIDNQKPALVTITTPADLSESQTVNTFAGTFVEANSPYTAKVSIFKDVNENGTFESGTDMYWDGNAFASSTDAFLVNLTPSTNSYTGLNGLGLSGSVNNKYVMKTQITDRAGNSQVSGLTNFVVDNTAPTAVFTSTDNSYLSTGVYYVKDGDNVTITSTLTEHNTIQESPVPALSISNAAVSGSSMSKTTNKVWSYAWTVNGPDNAINNADLTLVAPDNAGNAVATPTGVIQYVIDNEIPSVSLTSATALNSINIAEKAAGFNIISNITEGTQNGHLFIVPTSATITDSASVANNDVNLVSNITSQGAFSGAVSANSSWVVDDGAWKLYFVDAAGNVSSGSSAFTADLTAPAKPTAITETINTYLADGWLNLAESANTVKVKVEFGTAHPTGAKEGDQLELLLNGSQFSTRKLRTLDATDITNQYYVFDVVLANLGLDGSKSLSAQLTDVAGNPGAVSTSNLEFGLDTQVPVINSITIARSDDGSPSHDNDFYNIGDAVVATINADGQSYALNSGTVNNVNVTGFTNSATNTYTATYTVASGNTDRASVGVIPINFQIRDLAGNPSATYNTAPTVTGGTGIVMIDANYPNFYVGYHINARSGPALGVNPQIGIQTNYYIEITVENGNIHADELQTSPTISISGLVTGKANDNNIVNQPTIVEVANSVFSYNRQIKDTGDETDNGVDELITITGKDMAGNVGVNIVPLNATPAVSPASTGYQARVDSDRPDGSIITTNPINTVTETNISPVAFRFNFTEIVSQFSASNVTATNGTKGSLTVTTGKQYEMNVTPSGEGDLVVSVANSPQAIIDGAGNQMTVLPTAKTIRYDVTAPVINIGTFSDGNAGVQVVKDGTTLNFTFTVTEANTISTNPVVQIMQNDGTTLVGTATYVSSSKTSGVYTYSYSYTPALGVNVDKIGCKVKISVSDNAGNAATPQTTSTSQFTIDNTLPVVTINTPSNGSYTNGTQALTFNITDTNPNTSSSAKIGAASLVTVNSGDLISTLSGWSVAADGSITITVSHTDLGGNIGTSSITITKDIVKPVLAITAPTAGAFINGTQNLTFNLTEVNPTSTMANIASGTYTSFTSGTAISTINGWGAASQGSQTISIQHTDLAGNVSDVQTVSIVKDDIAPLVSIAFIPTLNATYTNGTQTIDYTITDVNESATTQVKIAAGTLTTLADLSSLGNINGWAGVTDGNTATITVSHTDKAGNTNTATTDVIKDITNPSAPSITLNSANPINLTNTITAVPVAINGEAFASVSYTVTNAATTTGTLSATLNGSGSYTGTVDLTNVSDGLAVLSTASQTDRAGNSSNNGTSTILKDRVAPTLSVTQPSNNSRHNDARTLQYTVSDNLDNSVDVQAKYAAGTYTAASTNSALSTIDGWTAATETANTFDVKATDDAGNTSTVSNTVTKDNTVPTISTYSPTHNGIASSVTENIVITFNESVAKSTTSGKFIKLYDGNDVLIEQFDVSSSSKVTTSGSQLIVDPSDNFPCGGALFKVTIDASAIYDVAGNAYGSINYGAYQFYTPSVPILKTISGSNITYCEGNTGASITVNSPENGIKYVLRKNLTTYATIDENTRPVVFTNVQVGSNTSATFDVTAINPNTLCESTMNGSVVVTQNPIPTVLSNPNNASTCEASGTTFTVVGSTGTTYSWEVSTDGGTNYSAVSANSIYSNVNTGTLVLSNVTSSMNGYKYRGVVIGSCTPNALSTAATLTVNTKPAITVQANNVQACPNANTGFEVTATGTGLTYAWQVSTNNGSSFSNISNGALYAGTDTRTLTILNASTSLNNYQYQVIVSGTCSPNVTSTPKTLTFFTVPTATISGTNTICVGSSTNLSVALTGTGPWNITYSDGTNTFNENAIASSPKLISVSPSSSKTYTLVSVTDANCTGSTSGSAIITVSPLPTTAAAGSDINQCNNSTFTINGNTPVNGTGVWSLVSGSASISNANSPTTQATVAVGQTATLRWTISSGACTPSFDDVVLNNFALPTVSFIAPPSASCVSSDAVYTTQSGQTNYIWTISGTLNTDYQIVSGGTTSSNTVTVKWLTTGAKSVSVNYTNSNNCSAASAAIANTSVNSLPVVSFIAPTSSSCVNTNVDYTTQSGQSNYIWTISGVANTDYQVISGGTSSDNTVKIKWLTSGSKSVSVNYTNSNSCTALTATTTNTTVNSLPVVSFIAPTSSSCVNTNVDYTTQSGQSNYTWTISGVANTDYQVISGGTSSDNTVRIKWLTSGSKSVSVNYTNSNSCSALTATTTNTTVNSLPSVSFIAAPSTVCVNDNAVYTTQSGQTNYTWTISGVANTDYQVVAGGTSSDNSVTIKWLTSGSKTVSVNYTNSNSCTALTATTANTTANGLPTATLSGTTTLCTGSSTNLSVALTGVGPWTFTYSNGSTNTTVTNTSTNPHIISVNPTVNTTYSLVSVSNANCTGTTSGTAVITMKNIPSNPGSITGSNSVNTTDSNIPYSVSSVSGAESYNWSTTGTGWTINGTGNSITIDFASNATSGTLTLTPANSCGNSANNSTLEITVNSIGTTTVAAGAGSEPATMSSLITSSGSAILNFDFMVTDDGAFPAKDAFPTKINTITISQGTGNTITTWSDAIATATLSDGTTTADATSITANQIVFSGLPTTSGEIGYVADNTNKTYQLKITLKSALTGGLANTIDGLRFVYSVNRGSFIVDETNGSSFLTGAGTDVTSGASNNEVTVVATKLRFASQPSNATVNVAANAFTIDASDANNNRDLGANNSVTLTPTNNTISSGATVSLASGTANFTPTFSTLKSGVTVTASTSGLTSSTSNTFTVMAAEPSQLQSISINGGTGSLTVTVGKANATDKYMLIAREGTSATASYGISATVNDGTIYTANLDWGNSSSSVIEPNDVNTSKKHYVMYTGSQSSINITNLTRNRKYDIAIYAYEGADGDAPTFNYNQTPLLKSQRTFKYDSEEGESIDDFNAPFYVADVAPNPIVDEMTITLNTKEANKFSFEIYSVTGQKILVPVSNMEMTAGKQTIRISLANKNLASGNYMLRVTAGDHVHVQPIVFMP